MVACSKCSRFVFPSSTTCYWCRKALSPAEAAILPPSEPDPEPIAPVLSTYERLLKERDAARAKKARRKKK